MQISTKTADDVMVLDIEGKLDALTSPQAESQITRLVEEGAKKLLVNFDKLDYVSSAGLRVLLTAAKRLESDGGELRICCLNDIVKEVFDISGFIKILRVFASVSEALDDF